MPHVLMSIRMHWIRKQLISILHCCMTHWALMICSTNHASQIYNVDKSGIPLNPWPPKVVCAKGRKTKKVRHLVVKGKLQLLLVLILLVETIPPMVIYNAANLNLVWTSMVLAQRVDQHLVEHFFRNCCLCPSFVLISGWSTAPSSSYRQYALQWSTA